MYLMILALALIYPEASSPTDFGGLDLTLFFLIRSPLLIVVSPTT